MSAGAVGRIDARSLLDLLPAIYRLRDAQEGGAAGPLESLLGVIAEQLAAIEENLDQLYDDQFVETAAEWAVPYLGDLIGYEPLHGVVPRLTSPRAEVANTISYRRRKGTASMIEQLARDVTGWPARVVESFQLLGWTQHMNHVRRDAHYAPDLRASQRLGWLDTAFDSALHTVDVRRATAGGRYNIPTVSLFLARLEAFALTRSPAVPQRLDADPSDPARLFRCSPLGSDAPLFTKAATEGDITHLAEPVNLPLPIGVRWMAAHRDQYYGPSRSVLIEVVREPGATPEAVPTADVRVCSLGDVLDGGGTVTGWAHVPEAGSGTVAIDPELGRIAFGDAPDGDVLVTFHYGAPMAMGGGEYERGESSAVHGPIRVVHDEESLHDELNTDPTSGTVEVAGSGRFEMPLNVLVADGETLVWRGANGSRPFIHGLGDIVLAIGAGGTLILDGLVFSGVRLLVPAPAAGDSSARTLILRHCTVVPGSSPGGPEEPGLVVLDPFAHIEVEASILGAIHAVEDADVRIVESIVDAGAPELPAFRGADGDLAAGGALELRDVTVVGKVHAREIEATNVLFVARLATSDGWRAPVWVERRQTGCVRFSFVPPRSRTPRRFRCQSEDDASAMWPAFTSLRYGEPGYGQLALGTAAVIRRGADDEGEIGALHRLYQPQREANLRLRLQEYLRFGLEAGLHYIT